MMSKTMTKKVHPAESSRKLIGVASGVALVGIVTGFQFSANAQEAEQAQQATPSQSATAPAVANSQAPAEESAPEAVPAPAAPAPQAEVVQQQAAVPAEAPVAVAPAAPAPVDADAEQIRRMQQNVVPNVMAQATTSSLREEIDELRRRGIEVDNDNEPVVENAWAQPSTSSTGQWIVPTICCHCAESKISHAEGKWKKFS